MKKILTFEEYNLVNSKNYDFELNEEELTALFSKVLKEDEVKAKVDEVLAAKKEFDEANATK